MSIKIKHPYQGALFVLVALPFTLVGFVAGVAYIGCASAFHGVVKWVEDTFEGVKDQEGE
jgi:hypothetical protein